MGFRPHKQPTQCLAGVAADMSLYWLNILPNTLWARIERRPNLQKALANMGWLFSDRLLRMGMGLLVGIWVARYLGPQQYGLLNFSLSIVGLLGSVAGLGLNGIVVRDLVKETDATDTTLGTAFLLQLVGGFLAFVLAVGFVNFVRADGDLAKFIVAVLGFMLVFRATDTVKYWFESQVMSKYVVWVENGVFLAHVLVRGGLILMQASLKAFVWAFLAEAALTAICLLALYAKKVGRLCRWNFRLSRAKSLLVESWPMILGAVASMINMRVDQVMLGAMLDDSLVGNYSAAVRISEIWLVVPGILGSSIFPALIAAKEKNETLYRKRILQVSKYMALAVLPVALVISLFSNQVAYLLYGARYATTGTYLAILIWSGVPYLVLFVFSQMSYIERLLQLSFYVSVFAIISNLSFNAILIPKFGGTGAAVSTLVTAFASQLLSLVLINAKTGIFWRAAREKE